MTQTSAAKGRVTAAINELIATKSICDDLELLPLTERRRSITASEKLFFESKVNVAIDSLARAKGRMVSKIKKVETFAANIANQEEALAYPAAIALHLETLRYVSVCQSYDTSLGRLHAMLAFLLEAEVTEDNKDPQENFIAGEDNLNASKSDVLIENRRLGHHANSPVPRSSFPRYRGFADMTDARARIQEGEGNNVNNFNRDRGFGGQHDRRNRGTDGEVRYSFPIHSSIFADHVGNNQRQFMNPPLNAGSSLNAGSRIDNANGVLEDTFGIIDPDTLPPSRNSLNNARANHLSNVRSFPYPGAQNNFASQYQPIPPAQSLSNPIVSNVHTQVTMQDMHDMMQYMQSCMQQMASTMAAPTTVATTIAPSNATVPAIAVAPSITTASATGVVPNTAAPTTVAATTASAGNVPAVIPLSVASNVTTPVTQVQVNASQTQVPLVQNAQTGTATAASNTAPAAVATTTPVNDPIALLTALTRRKARVPSLTVPIFDGTPEKYHDWWRTFAYTVHENAEMSPGERIMYLKQCVSGEAAEMLGPYDISETSYSECIAALKRRYENRLDEPLRINKKLKELKTCTMDAKSLRCNFTTVQACFLALNKLEPVENVSLLLDLIADKFPEKIRQKISRRKHQLAAKWTIPAILETVEEYVVQVENTVRDLGRDTPVETNTISNSAVVHCNDDRLSQSTQCSTCTPSLIADDENAYEYTKNNNAACDFCERMYHHAVHCTIVTNPNARRGIIRRKGLCYNCFSHNHTADECRRPLCRFCNLPHHKSICRDKRQTLFTRQQDLSSHRYEEDEYFDNEPSDSYPQRAARSTPWCNMRNCAHNVTFCSAAVFNTRNQFPFGNVNQETMTMIPLACETQPAAICHQPAAIPLKKTEMVENNVVCSKNNRDSKNVSFRLVQGHAKQK